MVQLKTSLDQLIEICRRNQVRELAVFGSVVREEAGSASDVDVLVEFQPGARVGFLRIAALAEALEPVFGRSVDLVLKAGLKPIIRDAVLREAEVLFATG